MTPTGNLTYPWGLVYIGILFLVVAIAAVLAAIVTLQRGEIKDLLARRDRNKSAEQEDESTCSRECKYFCALEDVVIPELQQEIDAWKAAYKNSEIRCELMNSTITKLRTNNNAKEQSNG